MAKNNNQSNGNQKKNGKKGAKALSTRSYSGPKKMRPGMKKNVVKKEQVEKKEQETGPKFETLKDKIKHITVNGQTIVVFQIQYHRWTRNVVDDDISGAAYNGAPLFLAYAPRHYKSVSFYRRQPPPPPAPSCNRVQAGLSLGLPSGGAEVLPGGTLNGVSATVTNNDEDCNPSQFGVTFFDVPSGWSVSSGDLGSIETQQSSGAQISITVPADATPGLYTMRVRADHALVAPEAVGGQVVDLLGQFSGGRNNQPAHAALFSLDQAVQHGKHERRGFAGPCLCQAHNVPPVHNLRNGLCLDRRGCNEPLSSHAGRDAGV